MQIAVVGCGSIGTRHIRNIVSLQRAEVVAWDADPGRLAPLEKQYGVRVAGSLSEVLRSRPDAAFICTPTSFHVPLAREFAARGCHLFVEKPLSHNLEGVCDLLEVARARNLVTLVGCNFKFHPCFVRMKEVLDGGSLGRVLSARCQFGQYLPDWHPWEDYRNSYSARSHLGGGILLDAHELDYMRWFLGEVTQVACFADKMSDLSIDTEDTAEVLLRFEKGTIGEVHLDYTQRAYQRNFEFFGDSGTMKWDFADGRVWVYRAGGSSWEVFEQPRNYDLNRMYLKETVHFLSCVESGAPTLADFAWGRKTLNVVLAAKTSARSGRVVTLEPAG